MSYFKRADVPHFGDTKESVILRGFTKNRFPIYEVRQSDGSYVLQCHDPEWTGA